MHIPVNETLYLRKPEPRDIEALYQFKNDLEVADGLLGFHTGLSRADIARWIDFHGQQKDEALFIIATREDDRAVGQTGFYQIDYRTRSGQYALVLGDQSLWGQGVGRLFLVQSIDYGFEQLNFHRIHVEALDSRDRWLEVLEEVGYRREGLFRQSVYRNGRYYDTIPMAILREDWLAARVDEAGS